MTKETDCWISLLSGGKFNYDDPENSDVNIEDIASALSNVCRFSGHLPRFYSVAQHLVNTSRIVPVELAYTGLMHDTAEAFTNDLPSPLKWKYPSFKDLETAIESAMSKKLGFEFPYPPEIKHADSIMLILEKIYVKEDTSIWPRYEEWTTETVEPYRELVDLRSWNPDRAKKNFLKRYWELENATRREATPREEAKEFFRKVAPRTPIRATSGAREAAA